MVLAVVIRQLLLGKKRFQGIDRKRQRRLLERHLGVSFLRVIGGLAAGRWRAAHNPVPAASDPVRNWRRFMAVPYASRDVVGQVPYILGILPGCGKLLQPDSLLKPGNPGRRLAKSPRKA